MIRSFLFLPQKAQSFFTLSYFKLKALKKEEHLSFLEIFIP